MNTRTKWARRAVWGTFLAVMSFGCNPITTVAFLLQGDAKLKTEMPLRPHLDANSEAREEIKIAILCTTHDVGDVNFAGFDRQMTTLLGKKFPEIFAANGCKEKIKVISPTTIDKFMAAHPQAKIMNPYDMGRQLGADYVFDITISGLQLFEPGSANQMYQGRAEVNVDVYDCVRKNKEKLYTYPLPFSYPHDKILQDASTVPLSRFKQEFMYKLVAELVLRHIDHKPSEGIATRGVR